MTPEQRDVLRALAEAATPGPWETFDIFNQPPYGGAVGEAGDRPGMITDTFSGADAAYIAAANPAAILELLARLAELDALSDAAHLMLDELGRYEREWLTSRTGYGPVGTAKGILRAALRATKPVTERDGESDRASEYGRLLAERDRLIADGADPSELDMPGKP